MNFAHMAADHRHIRVCVKGRATAIQPVLNQSAIAIDKL